MKDYIRISLITLNIMELYKETDGVNCTIKKSIFKSNSFFNDNVLQCRFTKYYTARGFFFRIPINKLKELNLTVLWNLI